MASGYRPMRFLLCIVIWIIFVGGLWVYTWQRDARLPDSPLAAPPVETVQGNYRLEITPTFSAETDPFALQADTPKTDSIELRLNGQLLQQPDEAIIRGKILKILNIPVMLTGYNEIFVSASPPISETDLDHGIRVRLLDGETIIVDDTIWAGSGARVSGSVGFQMSMKVDDEHEH